MGQLSFLEDDELSEIFKRWNQWALLMVYLTHKNSRGQRYYYLVKSYKQEGMVGKIQEYLGQNEPSKKELEQLKRKLAPEMEMKAVRKMAKTSVEYYNPPFLNAEQTYSLEKLRLLNRAINRMEEPESKIMNEQVRRINSVRGNLSLSKNGLSGKNIATILGKNNVPKGLTVSDVIRVINLRKMDLKITKEIKNLNVKKILKIYREMNEGLGIINELRNNDEALAGSSFVPPPTVLIKDELEGLIDWWERPTLMHPFEKAVLFHHRLMQIKPFEKDNGVFGRLVLDGMLRLSGFSAPNWKKTDKESYLGSLVAGDRGDSKQLIDGFWKIYRRQHKAIIEGDISSLSQRRQTQLEAF